MPAPSTNNTNGEFQQGHEELDDNTCNSSEDHCEEFGEGNDISGSLTSQGARKRKLERDRRNLINARFIELGIELQRTEQGYSGGARLVKRPKIDKEALLKEAIMRLVVQNKELASTSARVNDLLAQVDTMRIEMEDLRKDKKELYADITRLSKSNKRLWAACCKSTSTSSELEASPPACIEQILKPPPRQIQLEEISAQKAKQRAAFCNSDLISSILSSPSSSLRDSHVRALCSSRPLPNSSYPTRGGRSEIDKAYMFETAMPACEIGLDRGSNEQQILGEESPGLFFSNLNLLQKPSAGESFLEGKDKTLY